MFSEMTLINVPTNWLVYTATFARGIAQVFMLFFCSWHLNHTLRASKPLNMLRSTAKSLEDFKILVLYNYVCVPFETLQI